MNTNTPKTNAIWKPIKIGSDSGFIYQFADNCRDTEYEFAQNLEEENSVFRRLLALSYSGPNLYHDDGELQDNSAKPFIDFVRDSAEEIEEKIQIRGLNALKEELARNPNLWEDLKKSGKANS